VFSTFDENAVKFHDIYVLLDLKCWQVYFSDFYNESVVVKM